MESLLDTLRECGLLDSGVLAAGVERGWASGADVAAYAVERLSAGDDRPEVVELAAVEDLEPERVTDLLRDWARLDRLPSQRAEDALRRWMFAALTAISRSGTSPEEMLDRLEEAYAMFGYPEEMRKCSRYYVPPQDRARGIRVGEVTDSPLEAMNQLLSQLKREFGVA
jgi:hypothetical protein